MDVKIKINKEDYADAKNYIEAKFGIEYDDYIRLITKAMAHNPRDETPNSEVQKMIDDITSGKVKGQTVRNKKDIFNSLDL
ncbi:hypothetical protein [Pediococcus argentinicus]|uniref:Uncharacterized protein n=1 Tax=Pediococcus argentinicus TaxID=480391 RepID=A0A0R2NEP7_9LACO|nr:hypothetical protein [Pediococcus argentinicus]KRO22381.1 hypothetical protein IV88_GL001166 [Pediococcus argentinicus]NKZ22877.1 hypothetical protein [Pediococcus argentinicus]GEP20157.1 hypothetical protein LSA03_15410 [Pediococcus argentinicus]